MEKSPVHRSAVQSPQRSAEGGRQNGFAAELGADRPEARSNLGERFVPGNSLPDVIVWDFLLWDRIFDLVRNEAPSFYRTGRSTRRSSPSRRPFGSDPPHRIEHPVGRIHAIQILRYL